MLKLTGTLVLPLVLVFWDALQLLLLRQDGDEPTLRMSLGWGAAAAVIVWLLHILSMLTWESFRRPLSTRGAMAAAALAAALWLVEVKLWHVLVLPHLAGSSSMAPFLAYVPIAALTCWVSCEVVTRLWPGLGIRPL